MVYVDNANIPYRRMIMCHMIADTKEELYEMVDKIGVDRKWCHNGYHFDICLSKKKLAIKNGAVEISKIDLAIKAQQIRKRWRDENK